MEAETNRLEQIIRDDKQTIAALESRLNLETQLTECARQSDEIKADEIDRLKLERAQRDARIAVLMQRLATLSRLIPDTIEGNKDAIKKADLAALNVKPTDLVVARVNDE
jgi:predicted RNase H-like nuclease (RuvC/YqgF family)